MLFAAKISKKDGWVDFKDPTIVSVFNMFAVGKDETCLCYLNPDATLSHSPSIAQTTVPVSMELLAALSKLTKQNGHFLNGAILDLTHDGVKKLKEKQGQFNTHESFFPR